MTSRRPVTTNRARQTHAENKTLDFLENEREIRNSEIKTMKLMKNICNCSSDEMSDNYDLLK